MGLHFFEFVLQLIIPERLAESIQHLRCDEGLESTSNPATPGVNFINILWAPFLYESALQSFSLITVRRSNFLAKKYLRKSCS